MTIEDDRFTYRLRESKVAEEAALDGIYVITMNVAAEQQRHSIVRPTQCSKAAVRKERGRRTEDGLPVQGLLCLLGDRETICRNTMRCSGSSDTFERVTLPTDFQRRSLELLGVQLEAAKQAE